LKLVNFYNCLHTHLYTLISRAYRILCSVVLQPQSA